MQLCHAEILGLCHEKKYYCFKHLAIALWILSIMINVGVVSASKSIRTTTTTTTTTTVWARNFHCHNRHSSSSGGAVRRRVAAFWSPNQSIAGPQQSGTFLFQKIVKSAPSQPRVFQPCFFSSTKTATNLQSTAASSISLEIPTTLDTEEVGALLSALVLQDYINNYDDATKTAASNNKISQQATTIFLDGDLGAGKTAFARGFIRAATGDENLRVTSPTYLLVNVYPLLGGRLEIHHMDLYRLSGRPDDFSPLNLEHVFENCVSLIEWPERLSGVQHIIPKDRLDINIRIQKDADAEDDRKDSASGEDDKPRIMTLKPHGPIWEKCLAIIQDEGYLDDLYCS